MDDASGICMSLKGSPLVIDYRWDIFERNAFWTYRSTCHLSRYWYLDASGGSQLERLLGYDKHRSVSQKYTFYDSQGCIELGHQTGDWHPCFFFISRPWVKRTTFHRAYYSSTSISRCYLRCICLIYQIDTYEKRQQE